MIDELNYGYDTEKLKGMEILTIPSMDKRAVLNCFTTRNGGISKEPYQTLNLSLTRPCFNSFDVLQNYSILCNELGILKEEMVIVNFCHGDGIAIVDEKLGGNGLLYPNRLPPCDALITNRERVALTTIHADCSSLLIYDPIMKVVAACHAGWKGTLKRIGAKTIVKMEEAFGTHPENCIIGIGPNISFDKFEVDNCVADSFIREYGSQFVKYIGNSKYLIDLTMCAISQLLSVGVCARNITIAGNCTFTEKERFFSYRRDKESAGAMASVIMLK